MAQINCRRCYVPDCTGCNLYTLETMLMSGKLNCLMDEKHSITIDPASLRPKGEWISVLDRLPSENERVLACYINPLRKDRPPRMMVGEGTSTTLVKGKVYLWCGGWRSITHWMPLPEPPNTEVAHDS